MNEDDLPPDLIVMNCAECRKVMTPKRHADTAREYGLRVFAARLAGRPFCSHCVDDGAHRLHRRDQLSKFDRRRAGVTPTQGEENPWQSNAIRGAEDAQ